MSFNIDKFGTRAGVKASIAAEAYVPQQLKDLVAAIADVPSPSSNGLHVKGSGHVDSTGGGSIYEFKIESVNLDLDPPAPVAAAESPSVGASAETDAH